MEKIEWDERLNIGVEIVDKAHAKLFRIVGKLQELVDNADTYQNTYKEGIKYLEAYSMKHFLEEEEYMRSIRYGEYGNHKRIHDNFRDKTLVSLKKDLVLSKYSQVAVQRFVEVMNNWLLEHIMREDQAIVGKATVKRAKDFSSQLAVISKIVNRATKDVFQTEAKIASTDYKGENIGNGYYCKIQYEIEGGATVRILLGVEETLFLRGVNQIPGMQSIQAGQVPGQAALHVFSQISGHTGRLFKIEEEYPLENEDLLSRDDFRAEFSKGYPFSLLFSTKSGAFVFCFRSWRSTKQKKKE